MKNVKITLPKTDNTREMFSNHCVRFNADELEQIKKDSQRKQYLIAFFNKRGWLNCSHKSLERLESEFAVIKQH